MADSKQKSQNVAVHMSGFPNVSFESTMLPLGHVIDDKGGKVCHNIKEARKYASQQFERLITERLNDLYAHKNEIATLELSDNTGI